MNKSAKVVLAMDAKDNLADLQRKLSAIETAKVELVPLHRGFDRLNLSLKVARAAVWD